MKRIWALLLGVVLSVSLTACAENNLDQMYIEEAQLTEEEKNIAELLGLNQEYRLYDFSLDDTVKSMQINTYELIDGEWHIVAGGGGQAFEDAEGRLALGFDNLADGLRIAIQSEHNNGSTSYFKESENDITGMGYATSVLSDKQEIVYDQEIPLVIQIITCDTSKVITNKPKKMRPGSYCPAQNVQHKILRFHRRMRFFPSPYQACFSAPGLKSAARLP